MKKLGLLVTILALLGGKAFAAAGAELSNNSTTGILLGSGTETIDGGVSLTVSGSTDAIQVTNNSTIVNNGTISQTGSARAIRLTNAGVTLVITNSSTGVMQASNSDVVAVTKSSNDNVYLYNSGTINSINSSAGGNQGINWSVITTGTNVLYNYGSGTITAANADAVRPGAGGIIYNAGTIKSTTTNGSGSDGIDAQTNSGFTVVNAFTNGTGLIEGGRHGITGGITNGSGNYSVTITNNTGGTIQGDNGSGINIDGINGSEIVSVINNGTITGNGHSLAVETNAVSHDGDGIDVDGILNLTNTGTIRSIGAYSTNGAIAYSEGLTIGGGIIVNSGLIEGTNTAGYSNTLGRGISFLGNDTTNNPTGREQIYGNCVVTNQAGGIIRGGNDSAIVVDGPANTNGYTVSINNQAGGTIQGGSSSNAAIAVGSNSATIINSGTIDGSSSGKAISFQGGTNLVQITGGSAVVRGDIIGSVGGSNSLTIAAGTGNSFSFSNSVSNFSSIQLQSGTTTLLGSNSFGGAVSVSNGAILAAGSGGAGSLSFSQGLTLVSGSILQFALGGTNSFTSIHMTGGSTLTYGGTLQFNLSSYNFVTGDTFTLFDLSGGTYTGDFSSIMDGGISFTKSAGIWSANDGNNHSLVFNGSTGQLSVSAVPEPSTYALFGLGALSLLIAARRKKAL
ncbi:MAG: PEP-CTERM sorting domain-containing protein [bacterium]